MRIAVRLCLLVWCSTLFAADLPLEVLELFRKGKCEQVIPLLADVLAKQPKHATARRLLEQCRAPKQEQTQAEADAEREKERRARRTARRQESAEGKPSKPSPVSPAVRAAAPAPSAPAPSVPARLAPPRPPIEPPDPFATEREIAGAKFNEAERLIKGGRVPEAERVLEELVRERPNLILPRVRLAEIYTGTSRFARAVQQYETILKLPNPPSEMRLRLAQNLSWEKKLGEAAKHFRLYLDVNPRDTQATQTLANVLFWDNKLADAIPVMVTYLESKPDDKEMRVNLARALLWTGKYVEARPVFESLRRDSPDDPLLDLALGQIYEQLTKPEEALAAFRAVLAKNPNNRDALEGARRVEQYLVFKEGYTLQEKGKFGDAAKTFMDYLNRNPDAGEAVLQVARLHSWSNEAAKALLYYQAYIDKQPGDADARREMARLQMEKPDFEGARKNLAAVIDSGKAKTEDFERILQASIWSGAYEEAQPYLEKLTALDPDNEQGRRARGIIYARARLQELERARKLTGTGKYSEALEAYRRFTRSFGADREVELTMARLLSWDNQPAKAVQAYQEYLHRFPADQKARLEMADIMRWNANAPSAETEYSQILMQEPRNAQAMFGIAQIHDQRGDDRFAVYNGYKEVLRHEPGHNLTRQRMNDLAPSVSPSVHYRQNTFRDSDDFSRSLNTVEAAYPFEGGLRVAILGQYGRFNQQREVGGAYCGQANEFNSRAQPDESKEITRQICASPGGFRGLGGGVKLEFSPERWIFFTAEASAMQLNTEARHWRPMVRGELVLRPKNETRLVFALSRRDGIYDVNTLATTIANINSDTIEASYETALNDRWKTWINAGVARFTASRDRSFTSNFQRRITGRLNYQVTPSTTAGYYVRASGFRRFNPLYFSPEKYIVTGLSWTWDKPISNGLRFLGDIELGYGRILRYDGSPVNNLEASINPSFVWDIRPDFAIRVGYRFGRGRSSAFGSPVYGTGTFDFGLGGYFTPGLPPPGANRIEIR